MRSTKFVVSFIAATSCCFVGCSKQNHDAEAADPGEEAASATPIAIDGSSTVFPISEAVAEEFQKGNPARVTVAASGTGGGFKKFCAKEITITGASRPIKPSEVELCKEHGVEYIELPVAYDGIAVVVNKENDWLDSITVEELKKMWAPEAQGTVKQWSAIREGFPAEDLHLFGAGVDSGTYDYFTKAIVGKEHASRGDYQSSEDDNVLVQGVSTDKLALGFFGFAYYDQNKDKLKLIPVDDGNDENGQGAVAPTPETIENGTYQPLSRPIFIYVNKVDAERPEVQALIDFYLTKGKDLVGEVGYIALPPDVYTLAAKRFAARKTGSVFAGKGSKVGVKIADILKAE